MQGEKDWSDVFTVASVAEETCCGNSYRIRFPSCGYIYTLASLACSLKHRLDRGNLTFRNLGLDPTPPEVTGSPSLDFRGYWNRLLYTICFPSLLNHARDHPLVRPPLHSPKIIWEWQRNMYAPHTGQQGLNELM